MNSYLPHVLVLPEDDANSAIANGFALDVDEPNRIRVLTPAKGWTNARDAILTEHERGLRQFSGRHLVLLVDFDDHLDRGTTILAGVPDDLKDRVFVLGARKEPEDLRRAGLGTFEKIGSGFALECRDGKNLLSTHDLLKHNLGELARLRAAVFGIIF